MLFFEQPQNISNGWPTAEKYTSLLKFFSKSEIGGVWAEVVQLIYNHCFSSELINYWQSKDFLLFKTETLFYNTVQLFTA